MLVGLLFGYSGRNVELFHSILFIPLDGIRYCLRVCYYWALFGRLLSILSRGAFSQ
jgi:hypothetical protein